MKAWEVIGYTADADIWCPQCAWEVYGALTRDTKDHEGNPICSIFACEEWDDAPVCNCCREPLLD